MPIEIGQPLPSSTLYEFIREPSEGCAIGPNAHEVSALAAGKTVAILALPGAFTPTCSAKHLPGFVEKAAELAGAGVDEIWCVSVNDAFVMDAWGQAVGVEGKVRMMADGSAEFTKAVGMDLDLSSRGMGVRSHRYSMLVKDGVVRMIFVDQPGQFEKSSAEYLLNHL